MIRPLFRRLLPWLLVTALGGLALYQLRWAPRPVLGHSVARGEIVGEAMGTGTLEARVKTSISPRIQERLLEVLVDQGERVRAGQLLARLDDAESKQQVAIAEATLAAARQTAERVRADLARSQAVLEQARLDHKRRTGLTGSGAVSQAETDKASEALRVAEADFNRSGAAITEAELLITVAEKSLLFRREQLAFTKIHAPYAGLVIRRDRDPGEVVVPGASLLQMISLDEIWVSAWVDETAMPDLAVDQAARIVFRAEPATSYPGNLARLGRETDRETREFLIDVRAAELPANWTIGQRAEVFIETGRQADVVLLPAAFLLWQHGRPGVFVHERGRARWRAIKPGLRGGDRIAVAEGLTGGEQVVRPPAGAKPVPLVDGQRIKVQ